MQIIQKLLTIYVFLCTLTIETYFYTIFEKVG